MSAWAKPGVQCVCILPCFSYRTMIDEKYVVPGGIYKIIALLDTQYGLWLGLWGMPLDKWFAVRAFRPLVTLTKTVEHDAEIFRKISRQLPAPAKESA